MKVVLKKTGEAFDCQRGIALGLIEAGVCEAYVEPVAPKAANVWGVELAPSNQQPNIVVNGNKTVMHYFGPMVAAPVFLGETCPKEIFEKFCAALKNWNPYEHVYTDAERERLAAESLLNNPDIHFVPVRT